MKYLVIFIILFSFPAFAHDPGFYHHHDVVYFEDITQQPHEPEPISIYSNEEIQRDSDRIERDVDEYNERIINQFLEDSED